MKKRILSSMLIGVLAIGALSGCGGGEGASSAKDGEKTTLRITYSPGEIDGQTSDLDVVFEEFYEKHPNVEIVTEENGTALMAKIAANDAPDIIRVNSVNTLPTYVNKKVIIPIDDLLAKSELYDANDIYDICKKTFQYDGKEFGKGSIYGLPKDWSPSSMWVNKAMFEEAGVPVPTMEDPMTYDELNEYARKLTKKNGDVIEVYGYSDQSYPHVIIEQRLNAMGKSMYSEDYTKIDLSDETIRQVIKEVADLKIGGYTQSPVYPMTGNGNPEFAMGKCAINVFGLYAGSVYAQNTERTVDFEDMVLCPKPVVNEGDPVRITASPVGGVISVNADDIDLTFELWEFIHLGTPSAKRAASGFNLPVRKSVAESASIESEFQNEAFKFTMELAELEPNLMRTNPYTTTEGVAAVFEKYFTPLLYGEYEFDEALSLIESEIQLLIDEGMENV